MYKNFLKILLLYTFNYFKIFNTTATFNNNIITIIENVEFSKIDYSILLFIRKTTTTLKKFIFDSFESKVKKGTNNKKKIKAFLNKNFKFVNNNKFNIYNLSTEANRIVNIVISIIER